MEGNGETPLQGLLVVERAGRLAGGVCAGLLMQLGARVIRLEAPDDPPPLPLEGAPLAAMMALVRAGKERIAYDPGVFRALLDHADMAVVAPLGKGKGARAGGVATEEVKELLARAERLAACIITPYGLAGPVVGMPEGGEELFLQAVSGMMAVTGEEGGAPLPNGVPLGEMLGGLNGASAVLAALLHREAGHGGQLADIALFDGLVALLGAALPLVATGKPQAYRMGCRHPLTAPWNVYPTSDAAVIICMSTSLQWQRFLGLAGREEVLQDESLASPAARRGQVETVDRIVSDWSRTVTTAEAIRQVEALDIPVGAAMEIPDLMRDEGFVARGMVRQVTGEAGSTHTLAGPVFHFSQTTTLFPERVAPLGNAPSAPPLTSPSFPTKAHPSSSSPTTSANPATPTGTLPLAGLKVVELGVFTAGPISGRHLATLGASVVKVEPPGGESTRAWAPLYEGIGHYFANVNSDKQSLGLDLKHERGQEVFLRLCAEADVLVENLRPGALDKLGVGYQRLRRDNPGLIFFSLSGYGQQGPLAGKAAYDTVIQAGTGILGLVGGGAPVKLGVSIADMMGGQFAPLAIMAALRVRKKTGRGQQIDLAMRDATAWLTQLSWPGGSGGLPAWRVVRTTDGYVVAQAEAGKAPRLAEVDGDGKSAEQIVEWARAAGLSAQRVFEPDEVLFGEQVARRGLLPDVLAVGGTPIKVLECPYRLAKTPARVRRMIGKQGADNRTVLDALGYSAQEIEKLQKVGAVHSA